MPNDALQILIQSLLPRAAAASAGSTATAPAGSAASGSAGIAAAAPAGSATAASPDSGASAGSGSALPAALGGSLASASAQLAELRSVLLSQVDATGRNTQAVSDNTVGHAQSSLASAAGTAAKSVLGSVTGGSILTPIISGLMKLFDGGGSDPAPAPLAKYSLPPAIRLNAGISASTGLAPADYSGNGLPRVTPTAAPQVTVQISAMDSRSFLDRSDDIAQAVRRAMLESSALNDVVSEI